MEGMFRCGRRKLFSRQPKVKQNAVLMPRVVGRQTQTPFVTNLLVWEERMPPLKVEYAKSGRSVCSLKECSKPIAKGCVRIGTGAMMPGVDELRYKFRHLCCFTKRQLASVSSVDNIEGYDTLAPADQELVRKMVAGKLIGDASVMIPSADAAAAGGDVTPPAKAHKAEAGAGTAAAAPVDATARTVASSPNLATLPAAHAAAIRDGICPHGQLCFRLDARHFAEMKHPAAPIRAT